MYRMFHFTRADDPIASYYIIMKLSSSISVFFQMGLEFDKICVWKEPFPFNKKSAALFEPVNRGIGIS